MRTATTLGKTHSGKWVLISGPDVPITEQWSKYRDARSSTTNPDYEEIQYQEKDQTALLTRFKKTETEKTKLKKG